MTGRASEMERLLRTVEQALQRAFFVLRRQPRTGPAGYRSGMPTPLRSPAEVFAIAVEAGGYEGLRVSPGPASPADIELMDMALNWLLWIEDPFIRKVIAARAMRVPWQRVAERDVKGRSVRHLQRLHQDGLACIVARLAENNACRTCRV